MINTEIIEKLKRFTNDPDWVLMEDLVRSYVAPLSDIMTIDVAKSNDEIATEVRGRQLSIQGMSKFLKDSGILKGGISKAVNTTFK